MFRKLKSLLVGDDPNPQPSRLDVLDRYPLDVVADADDLTAVARSLGVTPPTDERIYRECLADRMGGAA